MASWPENPAPDRHPDPPARRPGQGLRAGQVPLRHAARGDALRRDALQPARPRQDQVDRHLGRREDARREGRRRDRQGGDDPPLPGRRHRRRRRRDRGAGPRRRPRDQGRVRGPAPRRHRAAGDGRRTPPRSSRAGNVRKGRAPDQGQARRGDGQGRRRRSRRPTRCRSSPTSASSPTA